MAGPRNARFAAALAAVALVSGIAAAQPQSSLPPLPVPQPAPPVIVPNVPPTPPALPTIDLPNSQPPAAFGSSGPVGAPGVSKGAFGPAPQRFTFKIEPNTPMKELLPVAPKVAPIRGPLLTDDLAKVPEVEFEARPEKVTADGKLTEQAAHQLAKIGHANAKKTDAFMAALIESRTDLAGLPFAMGDDCRTSAERSKPVANAVETVRQALPRTVSGQLTLGNFTAVAGNSIDTPQPVAQAGGTPAGFWPLYATLCGQQDAVVRSKSDKALAEHVTLARIAALMQMLAPESAELRVGLVKYLAGVPHVEATRALAKLAIFSAEDDVRSAAIESLKVRRDKDYTDILVKGLRYPFPAVAKRAADAIAGTGRSDLIGELVAVLDSDDPRLPQEKGKALVVREMVKVNHHRNCMMCHAPGTGDAVPSWAVTAEVPVQGQPLPSPSEGYRRSSPDLLIRIDVTYLRQDFSVMLAVADGHPWPELQRFDFLVRERTLTANEAATYREKLTPKEAGVLSPYHKAALAALRELTGKDTAPTAAAWRKLLDPK